MRRLLLLTVLSVAALTGCSGGDGPAKPDPAAKPPAGLDVGVFRTVVESGQWGGTDWDEWDGPAALGGAAKTVVIGTVGGFRLAGPEHAVLMAAKDTVQVKGTAKPAYELDVSDVDEVGGPVSQLTADHFAAAVPAGSRFLAFLDEKDALLGPQSLIFDTGKGSLVGAYGDLEGDFSEATSLDALSKEITAPRCVGGPSFNQDLDDPTPDATVMDWKNCTPADRTRLENELKKACPAVRSFAPQVKVTGDAKKAYECLTTALTGLGASSN